MLYKTRGTCSIAIDVEVENGMPAEEVIRRLKGIKCGNKPTSCPDQLALALEEALKSQN